MVAVVISPVRFLQIYGAFAAMVPALSCRLPARGRGARSARRARVSRGDRREEGARAREMAQAGRGAVRGAPCPSLTRWIAVFFFFFFMLHAWRTVLSLTCPAAKPAADAARARAP